MESLIRLDSGVSIQRTEPEIEGISTIDLLRCHLADKAVMLIHDATRQFVSRDASERTGGWGQNGSCSLLSRLNGKRPDIHCLGGIGQEIAARTKSRPLKIRFSTRVRSTVETLNTMLRVAKENLIAHFQRTSLLTSVNWPRTFHGVLT